MIPPCTLNSTYRCIQLCHMYETHMDTCLCTLRPSNKVVQELKYDTGFTINCNKCCYLTTIFPWNFAESSLLCENYLDNVCHNVLRNHSHLRTNWIQRCHHTHSTGKGNVNLVEPRETCTVISRKQLCILPGMPCPYVIPMRRIRSS